MTQSQQLLTNYGFTANGEAYYKVVNDEEVSIRFIDNGKLYITHQPLNPARIGDAGTIDEADLLEFLDQLES